MPHPTCYERSRKVCGLMLPCETELEMTKRHVRVGNTCLLRQRELVRAIRKDDPSFMQAKRLLDLMEQTQRLHLLHHRRARLAAAC